MTDIKAQIIDQLTEAFADVTRPQGEMFVIAYMFDVDRALTELTYNRWQDIPHVTLARNRDGLFHLTPEGCHFLLPAFLVFCIADRSEADVIEDGLRYLLIPPADPQDPAYPKFIERLSLISPKQSAALAAFFNAYTLIYPPDQWSFNDENAVMIQRASAFWEVNDRL